jgi:hypothetical protein
MSHFIRLAVLNHSSWAKACTGALTHSLTHSLTHASLLRQVVYVFTEAAGHFAYTLLWLMGYGRRREGAVTYWLHLPAPAWQAARRVGGQGFLKKHEGLRGERGVAAGGPELNAYPQQQGEGIKRVEGRKGRVSAEFEHAVHKVEHAVHEMEHSVHEAAEHALDAAVDASGRMAARAAFLPPHAWPQHAQRRQQQQRGSVPPPHQTSYRTCSAARSTPAVPTNSHPRGASSRRGAITLGGAAAAAPHAPHALHAVRAGPSAGSAAAAPAPGVPLVFIHGVGFGMLPYLHFVRALMVACPAHPVMVVEVTRGREGVGGSIGLGGRERMYILRG